MKTFKALELVWKDRYGQPDTKFRTGDSEKNDQILRDLINALVSVEDQHKATRINVTVTLEF